jgi:non-ribosomal peptide synthetase-like protein
VRSGLTARHVLDEKPSWPERLHTFFEHRAAATPKAVAVIFEQESISYADLNSQANRLARFLTSHGIRAGDRVGLVLPRSPSVYVALLGILKAGAAYVPLDPEYPAERIQFVLKDCGARALITSQSLRSKGTGFQGALIVLESQNAALELFSPDAPETARGVTPEDVCYVIYTSGTTGKPKGIEVQHKSVCHLVRAEAEVFRIQPNDRVFQGFSIAFDASVEEIWLAFCAGAALVVGSAEIVRAGPNLSRFLVEARVSVLSCVPTLLAMMEEDVPTLRLLILGGEVCPPDLIQRWWRPSRRVVNTYGPTESTVIATYAECRPDEPVTIGKPIPGALAWILDEALQPVPDGRAGELCLGGPGLARGYVNRPELTREKFVTISIAGGSETRVYRTGDRARRRPDGEIEFLGRLDGQVKLRGFRVELSEIEAVLMECPGVSAAAVALREDQPGLPQLTGYVVAKSGSALRLDELLERLRGILPTCMVPSSIDVLEALPTLTSGKIDRQRLPPPRASAAPSVRPRKTPLTPWEQPIETVWERVLGRGGLSRSDDFFLDLGGHSLLAARAVSGLRKLPGFEQISVLDLYRNPTIEELAKEAERRQPRMSPAELRCHQVLEPTRDPAADASSSPPLEERRTAPTMPEPASLLEVRSNAPRNRAPHSVPFWRHFWCGTAQLLSLVFVLTFFALQWLAPYLTYTVLVEEEYDFLTAVVGGLVSLVAVYPLMLVVPVLVKWLVIGRYQPGEYPLWGQYYFRWWLVTTVEAAVPIAYLAGTPLLNLYLRVMGARIGTNVFLNSHNLAIYDLVQIGSNSSINADANLLGYTIEDGLLKIGTITIGQDCFIGVRAAIGRGAVLEDGAALEDLSLLPANKIVPPGQTWQGAPAQPISPKAPSPEEPADASTLRRFGFGFLHGIGLLVFPILVVSALFPGIVLMNHLNYLDPYYWYLLLSPLVGASFILLLCLEIAILKWTLLGRIDPGQFETHSAFYLRKWFVDQTLDLSLDILGPLYASVYLTPWYKLLGAKLGRGAEISTASFISPDLLSVGEESFIADNASLGAVRIRRGRFKVDRNHVGRRSFVGNSALLPPGAELGSEVLLGCLSVPPANPDDARRTDTTWLGSPSFFLPRRQKPAIQDETATYHPSVKLRVLRATIEFIRVVLPSTCFIILLSLLFSGLLLLHDTFSLGTTLLFFPVLYLGCGAAATLFTILLKWALLWRYRAGERPLWSTFVWRNELLNALHEHLAGPFLINTLAGTPFLPWYFRLLGARIGRRVYLETTDLSEFDLVRIGDEAALNADCTIQTHLFEDRVMKISAIDIRSQARVGASALVLYDTVMEARSSLGDLSLLMKGEVLPSGTRWQGIPARAVPNDLRR